MAAEKFVNKFCQLVYEHNVDPEHVYNADDTAFYYYIMPTLARPSEKVAPGLKK